MLTKMLLDSAAFSPEGVGGGTAEPAAAPAPAPTSGDAGDSAALAAAEPSPFDIPDSLDEGEEDFFTESAATPAAPSEPGGTPTPAATPPASQPTPAAPAEPAAAAPAGPQPAAPADPAKPDAQAPQAPSAPTEASTAAGPTKKMSELLAEGKERLVEEFANGAFKLEQADIEALQTEPEKVVPKLFAKAHVESLTAVANIIERALPTMVVRAIQATRVQQTSEEEFFSQHSELAPYKGKVMEVAGLLRQMNPTMSRAEFIPKLVTAARVALAADGVQLQAAAPAAPAAAPASRPNGNGRASPVPANFAPAPHSAPSLTPPPKNEWEAISDMFNQDVE